MSRLRGPLGRYTITEQKLEGEFRYATSRLTTHGEEIAFYGGNAREKETVTARFQTLFDHLQKVACSSSLYIVIYVYPRIFHHICNFTTGAFTVFE